MLEVLRGREVSDVVAVVTRWFGGTLLGAGGLVRAYGDAVRAGLDEVGTRAGSLVREHELDRLDHADAGRRRERAARPRASPSSTRRTARRSTLRLGVRADADEPGPAWPSSPAAVLTHPGRRILVDLPDHPPTRRRRSGGGT